MSIELIERVDPLAVAYLDSISYDNYKADCLKDYELSGDKKPTENQIKSWYKDLKYFCNTVKTARGIVKRFYNYSSKNPRGVCGRLFCHGSVQSIWNKYRGLLMRKTTTDIDMKNAHPVILRYICKKYSIPCPNLEYYINHRDECLSKFQSRDSGKIAYLKATNTEKCIPNNQYQTFPELIAYDKEIKKIQKYLVGLSTYKELIDTVPEEKRDYNYNGSAINRILCYYENEILQHAIHILRTENIEIATLMFDGLLIYGNYYNNPELLEKIQNYVEEQMPGLNMDWCYKEHDTSIIIPENFENDSAQIQDQNSAIMKLAEENSWTNVNQRFEKEHAKIINKGIFIKETSDETICMSKTHLLSAYENLVYTEVTINEYKQPVLKEYNFISSWIRNNPKQRVFEDIGCYPNPEKCPKNYYNSWKPFAMEGIEYTHHQEGLDFIRNHIHILCGKEKEVSEYFEKWIGQMLAFPEVKTICPVLISDEGAGKGSLLQFIGKMLGEKRVFETADPARDVWGSFNGRMSTAFLVNLNELSKKDTIDSEGKIKALITDPRITINNKGVNQFEIESHHRFFTTTNNDEPVRTSRGDRRKLIIRSSDELIRNRDHFAKFYEYLQNIDVIATCYNYFKNLEGLDAFNNIPIPITEYQRDLVQLSVSSLERWLKNYATDNTNPTTDTTSNMFHRYNLWVDSYGSQFDKLTLVQFGVRLKRLGVDGIISVKGRNCNSISMDFQKILLSKNIVNI